MKAGVTSITTQVQQQATVVYQKARHLPTNHPHRTLLEKPCHPKLKRPNWRSVAKALVCRPPDAISSRAALPTVLGCPWAPKMQ